MKTYQLFLVFFIFIQISFGQSETENALLYKVIKNEQSAYLYGTIHIACDAKLSDRVKNALSKSDELILELDLDDPTLPMKMMQQMMLPEQKDASDFLSDKDYQLLKNYVNNNVKSIPNFAMVKNMKPVMLSSTISSSLLSCTNKTGYDQLLFQFAQQKNIEVSGLETLAEQMKVFDQMPTKKVYQEIVNFIKNKQQKNRKLIQQMMKYYNQKNLKGLKKLLDNSESVFTDYMDIALDERNKKWIPKIKQYLADKKAFIAFGAYHLVGEQGIVKLLRNEGYQVKPVN